MNLSTGIAIAAIVFGLVIGADYYVKQKKYTMDRKVEMLQMIVESNISNKDKVLEMFNGD